MECNKDEAFRAKSIALEKLEKGDFVGAKKFAIKAQTLYGELDGISQLLTTLGVYLSSDQKINGEVDWYGVLDVNPSADEETIKKHYRKLALVLHPDKNKSVGADGAFKLISQAWSLLSDKDKRLAYNQRRGIRGIQQKVSLHATAQTSQCQSNGVFDFGNRATATPDAQTAHQAAQSGPSGAFNFGNGSSQTPKAQSAGQTPKSGPSEVFCSGNGSSQIPKTQTTGETLQTEPNGTKAKKNGTKAKDIGSKTPRKPKPTPPQKADTFWTMCSHCKFHYEYVRMYLNCALRCIKCTEAFAAKETSPPPKPSNSSAKIPQEQKQVSGDNVPNQSTNESGKNVQAVKKEPVRSQKNHGLEKGSPAAKKMRRGPIQNGHDLESNSQAANKSGPRLKACSIDSVKNAAPANNAGPGPDQNAHEAGENMQSGDMSGGHSSAAKAATGVRLVQSKLKRANAVTTASGGLQQSNKKKRPDNDSSRNKMNHDLAQSNGGSGSGSAPRNNGFSGAYHQPNFRIFIPLELRNMMLVKARNEVLSKLNIWKSQESARTADKEKDMSKESQKDGFNSTPGMERHERNGKSDLSLDGKKSKENAATAVMTVPDPDFHDFDKDRTVRSFGDNQVWSVYDDNDGMPRLYALVHKVISRKPFNLRMSWLNSKTNTEFGNMDWVNSGFFKTCGEFRVGKWDTITSIRVFSQKVNWTKGARGAVLIYPRENNVWALYKNWSSEWDSTTPKDAVYKYDMVMILDNYNEEQGTSVAPLVKVAGFKTVFRPNLDPQVVKRIPKEEMFRFSHRVPYNMLTGQESQSAPAGCLELDPAAVPLDLLNVMTETNMDPIVPDKANVGA